MACEIHSTHVRLKNMTQNWIEREFYARIFQSGRAADNEAIILLQL